jgi:hypothetical protein
MIPSTPTVSRSHPCRLLTMATALAICLGAGAAFAATTPIVYPSGGQSPAQQASDEADCRAFAQRTTGFDPARGVATVERPPEGGGVRATAGGAATGAAIGALGGAIGGRAGRGAAIGASAGAAAGLLRRGHRGQQADRDQRAAIDDFNANVAEFNRAFATCMRGRGYAVH